jgi:hypothetical protein
MLRTILMGTAAGAVGTVALNVVTYLDMLVRGRPSSDVPAKTAGKLAASAGVHLASDTPTGAQDKERQQQVDARTSGLGALLGYVAGLGVGAVYGAVRPLLRAAPIPLTTVALGLAATAAGNLPSILTGSTDPRGWGLSGWLADLVPHLAYGLVTAIAYEAFTGGALGRSSTSRAEYASAALRHSSARLRGR